MKEANLQLARSKQASWSDTTVQKQSLGEHPRRWADEPVLLTGLANILNVVERSTLNDDNNEAGDDGGGVLSDEHDAGRDLHVMTKFRVAGEIEGLFRHDGAINLEDHNAMGFLGVA